MNFTPEQYKLIYNSVRRYQYDKTVLNSQEYHTCSEILDELFDTVYTQQREQPT
jgi:DNA-binding ferritin-like protein (Dps family)